MLRGTAAADPQRLLAAQRDGESWRRSRTRGRSAADAIAQALLDRGSAGRPLLILSGQRVDHLCAATLGAMTAGIPVAAGQRGVLAAGARDHASGSWAPSSELPAGRGFADDAERFAAALDAAGNRSRATVAGGRPGATALLTGSRHPPGPARRARARRRWRRTRSRRSSSPRAPPACPRACINTHRMLCANQQMMRQVWPFLTRAAGHGRLAAVEPHVRRQPQHQHDDYAPGAPCTSTPGGRRRGCSEQNHANLRDVRRPSTSACPLGYAHAGAGAGGRPGVAARFFARLRLIFNAGGGPARGRCARRIEALAAARAGRVPVTGRGAPPRPPRPRPRAHSPSTDAGASGSRCPARDQARPGRREPRDPGARARTSPRATSRART